MTSVNDQRETLMRTLPAALAFRNLCGFTVTPPKGADFSQTLILLACSEFNTIAACKAPCSVKTSGGFRRPPQPELDVAF